MKAYRNTVYFLGLVFIGLVLIRGMFFNIPVVQLYSTKSPFAGAIQQVAVNSTSSPVPSEGSEFTIKNVEYLEGREWVVAYVSAKNGSAFEGLVVLRHYSGVYEVVHGPGGSLGDLVLAMPESVRTHIAKNRSDNE